MDTTRWTDRIVGGAIKSISALLILLFSGVAWGAGMPIPPTDEVSNQIVGPFGTLNNYDSSIVIPSNKAQDLLNVDITPGGTSVKKRSGYSTAYTMTYTTSAVHGVYRFYDASGNEVLLFFNDRNITSSLNGNNSSVILSNGPNAATYQCVDYAGQAYCSNSSKTNVIQTNGSTATPLAGVVSTGTMVAVTTDRLVQAGFAEAPNRIDFSASALFTSWAQPFLLSTDPNQITITAPGSKITHIVYAFQRLMWFKDSSFGYVLFDNTSLGNWQVRTVSSNIGTLDNSSIYWQDVLYFRGQDGHFYAFDGSSVQRMSRDITASIQQAQIKRSNSWTQTSSADFGAGYVSNSTYADSITTSGQLQTTFPDSFASFRDGTGGTKNVWTTYNSGSTSGSITTTANNLLFTNNGNTLGRVNVRTTSPLADFQQGTTYHMLVKQLSPDTGNLSRFYLTLSSVAYNTSTGTNPDSLNNNWYYGFISTSTNLASLGLYGNSTSDTVGVSSSGITIPFSIDFYLSTTTFALSINGVTVKSGTHTWPHNQVYAYLSYLDGGASAGTCKVTSFGVSPTTFTFQSTVNNSANLTSWDIFRANTLNGGMGTHSFLMRSSTNSYTINSSTPAWNAVINGAIPTISTGTYIQVRDDVTTSTWTDQPALYDFTTNWFEGVASDKTYGQYFDYGLWWNVQLGGGASNNNYVLKYDLINMGWLIYDIPMNGMFVRSNSLYFGSATGGYVYKYGGVNNDNGAAINSYWKSKDFFGESPFVMKAIAEVSAAATSIQNSTITLTTTVDSRYTLSDTWPLYNPNSGFIKYNNSQPLTALGGTFNFKFGNNAADQPFEVFAAMVGYRSKPIKDGKQ